jgi:uncharacterized protein (TIGR02646 family)
MRPIDKSLYRLNKSSYSPYGDAKPDLIKAIGTYCSFCEREGFSSALDVEHIEDKENHPDKENLWSNFLLACKNCNSIKGTKEIDFNEIVLPHLNDTYFPFFYLESGVITIKDELKDPLRSQVNSLIQLVGLDRRPGHKKFSTKDDRWQERKQVWDISQKYKLKYELGKCDKETIIDLAISYGFWSVWMHAFEKLPEVQKELVNSFKGTNKSYFTF